MADSAQSRDANDTDPFWPQLLGRDLGQITEDSTGKTVKKGGKGSAQKGGDQKVQANHLEIVLGW